MASRKTASIGFRFNRNDEDLLTEVNEQCSDSDDTSSDRLQPQQQQKQSTATPTKTAAAATNVDSSPSASDEKKEIVNAVKEFGSRLRAKTTSSADHSNGGSPESHWLSDSWKKFQQFKKDIEERKEKSTESKKSKKEKELVSVSFGQGVNPGQSSINGDEESVPSFYIEDEHSDSKATTPTNEDVSESQRIDECVEELGLVEDVDANVTSRSHETTATDSNESLEDIFHMEQEEEKSTVKQTADTFLPFTQFIVDGYKSFRWNWSRIYYAISISMLIPAFLFMYSSPMPSFLNGLLFGVFATFTLCGVLIVVVINAVFIKKADSNNMVVKQQVSMSEEYSQPGADKKDEIFKEWMHEYLIDECNALEASGKKEKRTRMVYVRLDGTSLRLSIPKSDVKRSKLTDNVAKITFASQKHYDFAKMKNKRVYFWLPKSVRNRKKYVFAKKYPLILLFDKSEQNAVKTIRLVLFVHNNRNKEEWYQRFRKAMGIKDTDYSPKFEPLSDPPSPKEKPKTSAQSPSTTAASNEQIRRAQSMSSVPLGSPTSGSALSFQANYEQFLNKVLEDPTLTKTDSSSLLWFNLLIGRVFFDFLTHKHWSNWAAAKIQRKLSRIKLPYFIETLRLTAIDLGSSLPRFIAVNNPPKIDSKGLWVDFDVVYSGGLQMTLETKLNLMKLKDQGSLERELKPISKKLSAFDDLSDSDEESIVSSSDEEDEKDSSHSLDDSGKQMLLKFVEKIASSKYFQSATDYKYVKKAMEEVSNTPLLLTVNVHELRGTLTVNVPKPPSDRLWYGFRPDPKLILSARPQLGDHLISLQRVVEWIESKLTQMFNKILVVPNMDDVTLQIMVGNFNESVVSYVP